MGNMKNSCCCGSVSKSRMFCIELLGLRWYANDLLPPTWQLLVGEMMSQTMGMLGTLLSDKSDE